MVSCKLVPCRRPFHLARLPNPRRSGLRLASVAGIDCANTYCSEQHGILDTGGESGSKSGSTEWCGKLSSRKPRLFIGGERGTRRRSYKNNYLRNYYGNWCTHVVYRPIGRVGRVGWWSVAPELLRCAYRSTLAHFRGNGA
jgi:hypothetical protein